MLKTEKFSARYVLKTKRISQEPNSQDTTELTHEAAVKKLKLAMPLEIANSTFASFLKHIHFDASLSLKPSVHTGILLSSQQEYATLLRLQHTNAVPKLYGACGSFYAVEYLPTTKSLHVSSLWSGIPWMTTGEFAVHLMSGLLSFHLKIMERIWKRNMLRWALLST